MNGVLRFLADFCRDHPLEDKIYVAPSFVIGRQLGEALARESNAWINLRFVTLPSLAHETAALELSRLGLRLVTGPELLVFVDVLFRELQEAKRLAYFEKLTPSPGVAQALLRAIGRLRLEGLTSERIDPGLFTVAAKGGDLRSLTALYEERLGAAAALDLAGLYALAVNVAARDRRAEGARVLLSADTALSRLERDFLEAASGGRPIFCGGAPVFGLERPRHFIDVRATSAAPAASTDAGRLPWLFDPEGDRAPRPFADGSVEIFRALGRTNECREVLRRVLAGGLAFDEVEIVAPPGPTYPMAFHRFALRAGLPVTFADGLPLSLTSPGRALYGLLGWIEKDFSASTLCRLVESEDLRLPFGPGQDLPPQTVSRYLQQAQIGWGRGRYLSRLEALRRAKEEAAVGPAYEDVEDGSEDRRGSARRAAAEIARLKDAVARLLASIPDLPLAGPVRSEDLCLGLVEALGSSAVLRPEPEEREGQALRLVTGVLRDLAGGSGALAGPVPSIRPEAAFDRIRAAVAALTVGASAPRPGHLHISGYDGGGSSGRPMTFVLGLDDSGFPGAGLQDPILLDVEREKLSPGLPTNADSLKESVYSMAALLASLRGRVVVSYPSYDLLEDRASFPSSLVLQVHRLLRGDGTLDYASLEGSLADAAGFLPPGPDKAVDETEWWLGRLAGDCRPEGGLAAVRRHFPGLAEGIKAEEARAGASLGAYDGIVRLDRARFDPLVSHDLELSASRLERLVKCPFGYFLRYVLGIEPPEELERDLSRWLDAKDRGSLIHEILCAFMTRLAEAGERPDPARHEALMRAIAGQTIARWAEEIPPPSEGIFERERRDIDHALALFLTVESARPASDRPLVFEKGFSRLPVEIAGGRSFLLKGIIDRIDEIGPATFRILDYKTGSPKPFQDLKAFGQGRTIQHALYAVAAEKILVDEGLAREARVAESGYFFPTRRGEGGEVIVKDFDRGKFRALLADILALISKGFFPTTLKDECRHCDFGPVCGGSGEATKKKIPASPDVGEALERLKAYD
ncbi:MAG TPA: PD-(D/E)XK nuclease family protein [Acidobacteriota bacterium]|nr:PD-(D/E)XK nuclease family protein [Acidobacteriota bacterium]